MTSFPGIEDVSPKTGDGVTNSDGLVARWYGGSDLRLEREPIREPQPGETLVRMIASGICGSDVHALHGDLSIWRPPIILGHEGVGVVEMMGPGLAPARVGQTVAVGPSTSCGICYNCREGEELMCTNRVAHLSGFAEYALVPSSQLYPIAEGVSWRAGIFTEPLACVLHAISLSDLRPGEWMGIVGGGAIGLLLLQVALKSGAKVLLSEPDAGRRALALELGAAVVADPETEDVAAEALRVTDGIGMDRVVEAVGSSATVSQAIQMARRGGSVVVMGVSSRDTEVSIKPFELYARQLTLRGSFIRNFDFQRAVRMLDRLQLERLVTDEFDLADIHKAVEHVAAGRGVKTAIVMSKGNS